MTESIAALTPTPYRDPDAAPRALEHDTLEQVRFWSSDDGASFEDALDAVNPLHHLPVVSSIYRAVSDDTIGFAPRLIGAAIFGGPIGLILVGIASLIEEATGSSLGEHAVALFEGLTGDGESAPAQAIAAVSKKAEGDAGAGTQPSAAPQLEASALAEVPSTPAAITETPVAASPVGEKPAAATPAAMIATIPRPDVAAIRDAGQNAGQDLRNPLKDAESKRIAQTLLQAQRAQANLLLANLRAFDAANSRPGREDNRDKDEDRGPHSNLPPTDARPTWYADAMQRALQKYQTGLSTSVGGM